MPASHTTGASEPAARSAPRTGAPTGATPAGTPSPAAERRANMRRFWRKHPVLFALLVVVILFTTYERGNPNSPGWYVAVCGVFVIGLGGYLLSPAGARRQAEYDRSPDRSHPLMPMPKSPTGVHVLGAFFVLLGVVNLLFVAFGV